MRRSRVVMIQILTVTTLSLGGSPPSSALTLDDRATLWTANNNEIPVCFANGFREWPEVKKYIAEVLADTWEFNSQVLFTKLDDCDASTGEARVRVLVKRWDQPNWYGKTYSAGGMQALKKTGQIPDCLTRPPDDPCDWSLIFFVPNSSDGSLPRDRGYLKYLIVHEFGHILGFAHEQDTDRNFNFVNGSTAPGSIIPVPTTEIYCRPASKDINHHRVWTAGFDSDSVMVQGYCEGGFRRNDSAPWITGPVSTTGRLSPTDVLGLQTIYGKPNLGQAKRRIINPWPP